jgi:PAS domain S-box-containing protein
MDSAQPLYNSRIIKTYLEYIAGTYPNVDCEEIINYAGITEYEVEDKGHFFTQRQIDRFHEIIEEKTQNTNIARDAGRHSISTKFLNPVKQYALSFMSLSSIYLMTEKLYSLFSRAATVKAKKLTPQKVEIIVSPKTGVSEKPFQCENRIGTLEAVSKLFTNKFAEVDHPECWHRGDKHCRYIFSWEKRSSRIWRRMRAYTYFLGGLAMISVIFGLPMIPWMITVLLTIIVVLVMSLNIERLEKEEIVKGMVDQGISAKDRLDEIDFRYNSALLIQEIGQATSTIIDVDRMLQRVMDILKNRLDFDYGTMLLSDAARKRLLPTASFSKGHGNIVAIHRIVYLDNPDARGGLVVPVFRQKKPLLVNDIDKIQKTVSRRSFDTIHKEGIISFIGVPIVYEKEAIGTLFVYNTRHKRTLTQSDVNLLAGVAFQTAVSIANKKSFQKLQSTEERFRTIAEDAPFGISIMHKNERFEYINPKFTEIFGYTLGDIPDKQTWFQMAYPDDTYRRQVVDTYWQRMINRSKNDDIQPGIFNVRCKNGSSKIIHFNPVLLEDDKIFLTYTDITPTAKAEAALRESEEKYRVTVQSIPDSITITRISDGRYLYVNDGFCDLSGYSREEVIGKTPFDLNLFYDPEDREKFINILEAQGKVKDFDVKYRVKDGSVFDTLLSAQPLRFENEDCLVAIAKNITFLKQTEREKSKLETQLQQARKMEALGTLSGGIAHDFNNLLMGIQGNTSIMLLNMNTDNPHYEKLRNIERSVESGAELSRQLLGFARGGKYQVKPTDMNALIEQSSKMFGRTKKEIIIHRKYQSDIWTVEVDQGQMEQVMLNLYVNAWQAMPGGGHLYLETENLDLDSKYAKLHGLKAGRYVRTSFTDTGIGMDKATQEKIFDPFFTTKEIGRGTGLGLSSAYGIIKNHDGMINVYSEKDKGATFNIYLPASEADLPKPKETPVIPVKGAGTVLVVDDEVMILEVAREMLVELGYQVITAGGGDEAIALYRQHQEDIKLILLDMIMPDKSGQETFNEIKAINPEAKVLLCSGYSLNGEASKILEQGCLGFIQKPFNIHQVSQAIREAILKL